MIQKIVYKKSDLMGDSVYGSKAMRDIANKDHKKHVVNQQAEKKKLFEGLKKYRDGGVTEKELKSVLASLKYGKDDHFTKKEINILAKELELGHIEKKHLPSKSFPHTSRIDRANHVANSFDKNRSFKGSDARRQRITPNDDVSHYESRQFVDKIFGKKKKKLITDGDTVFEREEELAEFVDKRSGERFVGKTTRLTRPNMHVKSQASLRGRGLVAGSHRI